MVVINAFLLPKIIFTIGEQTHKKKKMKETENLNTPSNTPMSFQILFLFYFFFLVLYIHIKQIFSVHKLNAIFPFTFYYEHTRCIKIIRNQTLKQPKQYEKQNTTATMYNKRKAKTMSATTNTLTQFANITTT